MFIDAITQEDADGLTAEIYDSETERWGFLPEFVTAFSHHPESYTAWLEVIRAVYGGMDRRRCELATLAAARALRSTCCTVAHGRMLRNDYFTSDEVVQIARDHRSAGLDEVDVAIMDFAHNTATDPAGITASDVEALKSLGLTDREVFDVVLAVAARAFFATVVESLGVAAEEPFVDDLEPALLEALAVGRPARPTGG